MKKIQLVLLMIVMHAWVANAQVTVLPDVNRKASVSEKIGITNVQIEYNRPAVNGREDQIWDNVVHYGFVDLGFGNSKASPWRAGANENTTFEFSTDVIIEGKLLPAGKYGFFIAMGAEKATIIFSKFSTAWGSFYYDAKDDALRAEVPVVKVTESVERLKYEFSNQTENSAVVSLQWEKVKVPFTISVDLQKEIIAAFRRESNSAVFYTYWQNLNRAANYCLVNNIHLEEGLEWSNRAVSSFFGDANFTTLSTQSGLLEKLGQKQKADSVMKKAIPMATSALPLYLYARNLVRQKKNKEAFEIYKIANDKYPKEVYGPLGMARGYAALGNTKEALKYADKVLTMVEDSNSKAFIEKLKADIKEGKDISK